MLRIIQGLERSPAFTHWETRWGGWRPLGDIITANVKEASPDGTVKKGQVVKAVIVQDAQRVPAQGRHLYSL